MITDEQRGPARRGRLEQAGGRWRLRFVRELAHPPEKVWRALTEPEHLAAWFPATIEGERAAGAELVFTFPGGEAPAGGGRMLVFDPPSALELEWGEDNLRFELEAVDGGTRLTFLHTFAEKGKAARDAAGWHVCLDALGEHLGAEGPRDGLPRWDEVHPGYVEAFGPEAAEIGPPT